MAQYSQYRWTRIPSWRWALAAAASFPAAKFRALGDHIPCSGERNPCSPWQANNAENAYLTGICDLFSSKNCSMSEFSLAEIPAPAIGAGRGLGRQT
jgi:hypothetical protein